MSKQLMRGSLLFWCMAVCYSRVSQFTGGIFLLRALQGRKGDTFPL
jgi:hypothetical protein